MMTVIIFKINEIKDLNVSMQQSKLCVLLEPTAMQHTGSTFGGYTIDWVGKEEKSSPPVRSIQKEFPESDGNYTGFKDPTVTEVDLALF